MKFFSLISLLSVATSAITASQESLLALQGVTGKTLKLVKQNLATHQQHLQQQMEAVETLSQWVKDAHHTVIQEHKAGRKLGILQCGNQIASSSTKLLTCANQVYSAFSETGDKTESGYKRFADSITQYCNNGCADTIKTEIGNIVQQCTSKEGRQKFFETKIGSTDFTINSLFIALKAPCYTAGTSEYCFPKYLRSFDAVQATLKEQSTTNIVLNSFCSPCTTGLFKLFAQAALKSDTSKDAANFFQRGFDLLCLKEGADFCIVKVYEMYKLVKSPTLFSTMCQPCVTKYISAFTALGDKTQVVGGSQTTVVLDAVLRFACEKNKDGQKCYQLITGTGMDSLTQSCAATDFFGSGQCQPACTQALQTMAESAKCCGGNILVVWRAIAANSGGDIAPKLSETVDIAKTFADFATNKCKVPSLFAPCANRLVKSTMSISNIRQDFFEAKVAAISEAVKQDVATMVAEPKTSVNLTNIASTAGSTLQVALTVTPTLQDAASVSAKLRGQAQWLNLEQLIAPPEREDPFKELVPATTPDVKTVDSKTNEVIPETPMSSASSLHMSAACLTFLFSVFAVAL
mmetsp:Transcript_393/g.733  ORF Transcript_393/g.733 Transcript_393/m.733 type:complete len:577 (+) Transcript_393:36-1766(+)|eukprot:CAMPEP_0175160208 /NCGR_PEP_ID=MMETSP0087-20121206/23883_1 /TAXON_ID=136419 /ORGANISM="Unknown Unknown, Strain D1" /LENGTH=576 /DNA_ID=CAMNT_0016448409 /DNA_START=43 /DNA_END=1773 /DNA_ORIENTATION=-